MRSLLRSSSTTTALAIAVAATLCVLGTPTAAGVVPSGSGVGSRPTHCLGTVKVTTTDSGEVLGRLSLASGVANPTRRPGTWTTFRMDRVIQAGGFGRLRVPGTGRVLEGVVGGRSAEPTNLMETGTADNLYLQAGDPHADPPFDTRATEIWKRPRAQNGDLRVVWTQPDGGRFPMTGWYDPASSYTGAAADFEAFDADLEGRAEPVDFTFVPARDGNC